MPIHIHTHTHSHSPSLTLHTLTSLPPGKQTHCVRPLQTVLHSLSTPPLCSPNSSREAAVPPARPSSLQNLSRPYRLCPESRPRSGPAALCPPTASSSSSFSAPAIFRATGVSTTHPALLSSPGAPKGTLHGGTQGANPGALPGFPHSGSPFWGSVTAWLPDAGVLTGRSCFRSPICMEGFKWGQQAGLVPLQGSHLGPKALNASLSQSTLQPPNTSQLCSTPATLPDPPTAPAQPSNWAWQ